MILSISNAIMASGVYMISTVLVSRYIIENLHVLTKMHVRIVLTLGQLKKFVLESDECNVSSLLKVI